MAQEQTIELRSGETLVIIARLPAVLMRMRKRGRPLANKVNETLEATKPWVTDGLSRATWYRRQAEKRK